MTYLLDTDIVNYLLRRRPSVRTRFEGSVRARDTFVLSPVVHFEVVRSLQLKRSHRMLAFYTRVTAQWGRYEFAPGDWDLAADLWAERHRAGRPIQDSDLLGSASTLPAG